VVMQQVFHILAVAAASPVLRFDPGATLSASCLSDNDATVQYVSPAAVNISAGDVHPPTIKLRLSPVHTHCVDQPLTQPCVAHDADYPKLFMCSYLVEGGAIFEPAPVHADLERVVFDGETLAMQPYVQCPFPTSDELSRLTESAYGAHRLTLTLSFGAQLGADDARTLGQVSIAVDRPGTAKTCRGLYDMDFKTSGEYTLEGISQPVYCDMSLTRSSLPAALVTRYVYLPGNDGSRIEMPDASTSEGAILPTVTSHGLHKLSDADIDTIRANSHAESQPATNDLYAVMYYGEDLPAIGNVRWMQGAVDQAAGGSGCPCCGVTTPRLSSGPCLSSTSSGPHDSSYTTSTHWSEGFSTWYVDSTIGWLWRYSPERMLYGGGPESNWPNSHGTSLPARYCSTAGGDKCPTKLAFEIWVN